MTIFPLRDHIRKKNIKLHENSFLSEVGGGVLFTKKTQIASPSVILKHQNENHSGMYDLKNPRAEKHEKQENDVFFSAR